MNLLKKSAVVTGAAGGIGAAVCRELAADGYRVAAVVRKADERSEALRRELGEDIIICAADISDYDECEKLVSEISGKFGGIEVLVNNAGITRDNLVLRMTPRDFETVVSTNLNSAFYLSKLVFPIMMKARRGRIINISSYVGLHGNSGQANYSAAKAGLIGLTKSLAREFASRGVLVNAVAPGFIETPMTDVLAENVREAALAGIPLKRFGRPKDVAAFVGFLASEKSAYITGQVFSVDGGMSV